VLAWECSFVLRVTVKSEESIGGSIYETALLSITFGEEKCVGGPLILY